MEGNSYTIDNLCELLESVIHLILCHRGIYPHEIFGVRAYYYVPLPFCENEDVQDYVQKVVKSMRILLTDASHVKYVKLSVIDNRVAREVERHTFEIGCTNRDGVRYYSLFTDLKRRNETRQERVDAKQKLESHIRDFLLSAEHRVRNMKSISDGHSELSWRVSVSLEKRYFVALMKRAAESHSKRCASEPSRPLRRRGRPPRARSPTMQQTSSKPTEDWFLTEFGWTNADSNWYSEHKNGPAELCSYPETEPMQSDQPCSSRSIANDCSSSAFNQPTSANDQPVARKIRPVRTLNLPNQIALQYFVEELESS